MIDEEVRQVVLRVLSEGPRQVGQEKSVKSQEQRKDIKKIRPNLLTQHGCKEFDCPYGVAVLTSPFKSGLQQHLNGSKTYGYIRGVKKPLKRAERKIEPQKESRMC